MAAKKKRTGKKRQKTAKAAARKASGKSRARAKSARKVARKPAGASGVVYSDPRREALAQQLLKIR